VPEQVEARLRRAGRNMLHVDQQLHGRAVGRVDHDRRTIRTIRNQRDRVIGGRVGADIAARLERPEIEEVKARIKVRDRARLGVERGEDRSRTRRINVSLSTIAGRVRF
jgi:hypothetical protein